MVNVICMSYILKSDNNCSQLIGTDENGGDLEYSYGVTLFKEQVIKGVGKFSARVYHEYLDWVS